MRGTVRDGGFYGAADGDLRWFSPWTVTSKLYMLLAPGRAEFGDLSTTQNDEAILLRSR